MNCRNCGVWGHVARICQRPVISFGLIAVRWSRGNKPMLRPVSYPECTRCLEQIDTNCNHPLNRSAPPHLPPRDSLVPYLLMVQRKDTMAFTDLITGNYDTEARPDTISTLTSELTCTERQRILIKSFADIWKDAKFDVYKMMGPEQSLPKWQQNWPQIEKGCRTAPSHHPFTEFGFPKGRRDMRESPLATAIREFSEETGFDRRQVRILERKQEFVEEFIGTDGRLYRHIYYLAGIFDRNCDPPSYVRRSSKQAGEVVNVGWFTPQEASNVLRHYDETRRKVLEQVCSWLLSLKSASRGCDRCRAGLYCVQHSIMLNQ